MKFKEVSFSTIKEHNYNLSARTYVEETYDHADREYWVDSAYRKKVRQRLRKYGYTNIKTTNEVKEGNCRVRKEVWVNQWSYALVFLKIGDSTYSINFYKKWGKKVENAGQFIRQLYTKRELEGLLS